MNLSTSRLAVALLVAATHLGCTAEAVDEAESSADAVSEATYPSQLEPFLGDWTLDESRFERPYDFPEDIRVVVETNVRSAQMENGTVVSLLDSTRPGALRFRDRAPFIRIGAARTCSDVDQGEGTGIIICHESRVRGVADLEHTLKFTSYNLVLRRSSTSTQRLTIEGKRLHYEYADDGKVVESYFFRRAR